MDSKHQENSSKSPLREFDRQAIKTLFIVFALITVTIDYFVNGKEDNLKVKHRFCF
jgi:hypothetical protein